MAQSDDDRAKAVHEIDQLFAATEAHASAIARFYKTIATETGDAQIAKDLTATWILAITQHVGRKP